MGGTYTVTATVSGCSASATTTVVVNPTPIVTASNAGPYCTGQTISLSSTGGGTYAWTGPNSFSSISQNPTLANATVAMGGAYTVTATVSGCSAAASTTVIINAGPSLPVLSPLSPCPSSTLTFTAGLGTWFEFFINGVSSGPASANNVLNASTLTAGTQVCVKSYPTPTFQLDGQLNEAQWGNAISTSTGGPSSGFGANYLDALYVNASGGYLFGGIAGQTVNNSNNRILLFIDCISGGFNNLNDWDQRFNAPYYSAENLSDQIVFDPGFNPDFILCMNQAGGIAYFDLYNMQTNTNYYLGSDVADGLISSNLLGYQPNGSQGNLTQGFEFAIPLSLLGSSISNVQFFAMLVNDPGQGNGTFVSNQFLSPAGSFDGNYGNGFIDFGSAPPNPISYVISQPCFQETCTTIASSVPLTFNPIGPICYGAMVPALPSNSLENVSGVWSPTVISNTTSQSYTFTPNATCASPVQLTIQVLPQIVIDGIFHD